MASLKTKKTAKKSSRKTAPANLNEPISKNWNVMVYMAADNSLSEECIFSLKEMQRVGTAEGVKVLAQFHSSAKGKNGQLIEPRRYSVRGKNQPGGKDGELKPRPGDVVRVPAINRRIQAQMQRSLKQFAVIGQETEGEKAELVSASNPNVLEEFIQLGISESLSPDARLLLILSGHGNGAVGAFLRSVNAPSSLDVSKFAEVFSTIERTIDIVLMDSCLMSMAEVAYELSPFVDYLIGAEGYELSTGWPYHHILETINDASASGIDNADLACDLIEKYVNYYADYDVAGVSVDMSVCHLKQIDTLVNAVKDLKDVLMTGIDVKVILYAVLLAHWRAQSYHGERYVDLWDFCDQLGNLMPLASSLDKEVPEAFKAIEAQCQKVKLAIKGDKKFVIHSAYSGAAFQHSHGVSIYFPWAADTENVEDFAELVEYKKLDFHLKATKWGDFIEKYLKVSRREVRNGGGLNSNSEELICFVPTDHTRVGVRTTDPPSRGDSVTTARVKNPPVSFVRAGLVGAKIK